MVERISHDRGDGDRLRPVTFYFADARKAQENVAGLKHGRHAHISGEKSRLRA
jgi:hypothetical protein